MTGDLETEVDILELPQKDAILGDVHVSSGCSMHSVGTTKAKLKVNVSVDRRSELWKS